MNHPATTETPTLEHLRALVLNATDRQASESVRAAQARTVVEYVADLRDLAQVAAGVLPGSQALDYLRATSLEWTLGADGVPAEVQRAAGERIRAREVAGQLRAVANQTTVDTPGLLPRPVDVGTGSTGLGGGLPLIRRYALDRDFVAAGKIPTVPGVVGGDDVGDIIVEKTEPTGAVFTIGDVGAARARAVAVAAANFSSQLRDWSDETALAMIDQIMLDVADRAAEVYIGGQLVAAAGGTRVAGADLTTLGTAIDAAEAAASAAVNGAEVLLLVNPANLPKVRRALAGAWIEGLPHPVLEATVGMPAGTATVVALDGVHLFRDDPFWLAANDPATFGYQVSASRPLYFAVRKATGIQTVTAIPA